MLANGITSAGEVVTDKIQLNDFLLDGVASRRREIRRGSLEQI